MPKAENTNQTTEPVDFDPFAGNPIEKISGTNESQRELWLSCILGGNDASLAYNESVSLELDGSFDLPAFNKALTALVARHEALRATVSANGENLVIYQNQPFEVFFEDISTTKKEQQREYLKTFIHREIGIPFDLQNGPLFRFFVHKLTDDTSYFTLIIHHIIGDGWSIGIILQDLGKLYSAYVKGITPDLEAAPQISNYSVEHNEYVQSEEYKETENFWLSKYKGNVPVLNVPTDYHRPSTRTYKGSRDDYSLEKNLVLNIKNLAKKAGCSLVSTLLTAFEVFLYQKTGQQDIVVGLPAAGQSATGNYGLVGHCVNLLPLRSKINPSDSFIAYLKNRKGEIYDAYDHQRLTFGELLKKLNIKRDSSQIPLVPVVFNVDMGLDDNVVFHGLTHKLISNPRVCQTFEISLNATGSKDSLVLEWAYNTQLFKPATIKRMMDEFELLLEKITQDPDIKIEDISTSSTPFQKVSIAFPENKTIVDLFVEQSQKTPDRIAIVFEGKKMTYRELDRKSNQLAHYLRAKGIKEETFVPLCVSPSLEMIVGILGILKVGAAYVPVEPEFPEDRVSYMIDDTAASVIVSSQSGRNVLKNIEGKEIILLDSDWRQIEKMPVEMPVTNLDPSNLLYLIYTSGSTGKPKGVMIEHRSLVDYVYGFKIHVPVKESHSFALGSTIATDLGNTILYSSLVLGGELHLFHKERFNDVEYIHQYFKKNPIDCLKIVPSHWKAISLSGKGLYPKKLLVFGGESLHKELIREIHSSNEGCLVVNHYGPTETTIGKLLHVVNPEVDYGNTVPIGKPFSNASAYILNEGFKHCSIGVPGEIYLGGVGVARGYLNREDLTAERFIKDIFSETPGTRMYRTGDLAKWLPDGNIEYLGRIDDQVKIRGNRIELGEIGNVLQEHPGVKQSVVIAHESGGGDKRLVGYIVPEGKFDKESIISYVKSKLPEYMIPRLLIELARMPLTDNGKVDRKALPKPEDVSENEKKEFVAPETDFQKVIAKIWAELLGLKQVSITDDFFELGGHSLLALRSMLSIEKKTGKRLPLAMLFENSTIEKLAKVVEANEESIKWDCFVPIKTTGNKMPVYLIHGGGLNVLTFRSMIKDLHPEQPVYGLQAKGLNGKDQPLNKMEEIAAHYISEILKHNPDGPYALAGYSFGGLIAFEMGKQLKAMGKEIAMLGVFDTFAYRSDYYDPLSKKIPARIVDFFNKVWCTFVLMANDPWYIIKFRTKSIGLRLKKLIDKTGIVPREKDPDNFYVYSKNIIENLYIASRDYKLTPYDGTLDLFRAKRKTYYLPDFEFLGWKPYALKGINIYEVPGEHAEIFDSPHSKELAKMLQLCLDRANGRKKNGQIKILSKAM